jgi:hypothetical protein
MALIVVAVLITIAALSPILGVDTRRAELLRHRYPF